MIIAVATDHAGFPLKESIIEVLKSSGFQTVDLGTNDQQSVDYPDYAEKLGKVIQSGNAGRGVLLCGSGVGASVAANKMKGIYAGVCHDTYSAHQSVEHDNMNVLCLGARVIGEELAKEIVLAFANAHFSSEDRHVRRVMKIKRIENGEG